MDDALQFCRADGTHLVSDSAHIYSSSTLALPSAQQSAQIPTRLILDTPSIAVLPFVNMSADAENDYFCDGLAEEILNALAKIAGLKVAARTSAFSFKNKNVNVEEIGRALHVNAVLEGSVRKAGNRLRVTTQLINVSDGYHLWSERYDRQMDDVFDVQDEITLAVVDALRVKLLGEEKVAALRRYTDNTEAYELYLKGRYHYYKYTGEGWLKAIEFFERAIAEDPEYAPAYAALASVLDFSWFFSVLPAEESITKCKAATLRALELDDGLDEAHSALARVRFYYEWAWEEAESEFRRAIDLKPNNAESHQQYGISLACIGRCDEAISEAGKALELDPLSLLVSLQVGWVYLLCDRLDDVLKLDRNILEREPNFHGAYWQMGTAYEAREMYEEALDVYQKALTLGGYQVVLSNLGAVYAKLGRRNDAYAVMNQLLEMKRERTVAALNIARVYSGLGENDKAFEWLEKAIEERNGGMVFLSAMQKIGKKYMWGEGVCTDPRFTDIMRRVGLPQ
jgi:serine/threonine-protein kinase